ncbi:MAG TPA: delta-60 repeat domain-containing protein, partial [Planctomycetota bacterium]|nr:delta-60 repeat domain-containing protein [Planctomycetota bacterium]
LIVGGFKSVGGVPRNSIARLNPDGSVDAAFATGSGIPYGEVALAAARDGSGDVYVGGDFNAYNGAAANRILRLNADGSVDAGFDVGAGVDGIVRFFLPLADGRVYLAGNISVFRETTVDFLARTKADGTVE